MFAEKSRATHQIIAADGGSAIKNRLPTFLYPTMIGQKVSGMRRDRQYSQQKLITGYFLLRVAAEDA